MGLELHWMHLVSSKYDQYPLWLPEYQIKISNFEASFDFLCCLFSLPYHWYLRSKYQTILSQNSLAVHQKKEWKNCHELQLNSHKIWGKSEFRKRKNCITIKKLLFLHVIHHQKWEWLKFNVHFFQSSIQQKFVGNKVIKTKKNIKEARICVPVSDLECFEM